MKQDKPERIARTLFLDKRIDEALHRKSCELSMKQNKRVTRSSVVEQALLKFGCKIK